MAGDRGELDQAARRLGQVAHALPQELVQACGRGGRQRLRRLRCRRARGADGLLHQLADEHRAALGLDHDALGVALGIGHRLVEQRERELLGFAGVEGADREVMADDALAGAQRQGGEGIQAFAALEVFRAVGEQHQHRRRSIASDEVAQQCRAFDIAPLEIVDRQHHRLAGAHLDQQRAQCGARLLAGVLGVARLAGLRHQLGHRADALEHREHARQAGHARRQGLADAVRRQRQEVAGEGVDEGVDRLVRHQLVLVAASGEHQRALGLGLLVEAVDQGALARAARALQVADHRGAVARGGERAAQRRELRLAADERPRLRAPLRLGIEQREDLLSLRALAGLAAQQRQAQRLELLRHAVGQLGGHRRVEDLLVAQHRGGRAGERQTPGQGLEEHRSDRIPVAGRAQVQAGGLLGRHVACGADDRAIGGVAEVHRALQALGRGVELLDQAEIEQHQPPLAGHQGVAGLEVAVQAVVAVQLADALAELDQERAQGVEILDRALHALDAVDDAPGDLVGHARAERGGLGWRLVGQHRTAIRGLAVGDDGSGVAADVGQPALAQVGDEVEAVIHQLHGEEPALLGVGIELVQLHQIAVEQLRERAELPLDAVDRRRIRILEHLERDARLVLPVERLVDDAHPALADAAQELEAVGADRAEDGGFSCHDPHRRLRATAGRAW